MVKRLVPFLVFLALVAAGLWFALRSGGEPGAVTVYTSVDEEFARGILARFEKESGIPVKVVCDTEATKTIGLAQALLEEGSPGRTPRADVFWNNEPVWTVRLAAAGVLERYDSPAAKDIPPAAKDAAGFWVANGLRARVFIANPGKLAGRRPASYLDLASPEFRDAGSMARPLAGTTLSHFAALRSLIGPAPFEKWLKDAAANGTAFASGNGAVARDVGAGGHAFGLTDTDDYWGRKSAGEPVEVIFPDQGEGQVGTFVLPLTVSLVRGGPHPANARRLFDFLVSAETEAALSATPYASIPVRASTKPGPGAVSPASFRAAKADWNEAFRHIDAVLEVALQILQGK